MRNFLFIICCTAAGILAGCTDDANSVGNKLINPNEKFSIADTTLICVSDTVFNVSAPNGYGVTNVVGRTNDVESMTWLKFIGSTLNDSLRGWAIDTVELKLVVTYTWNISPSARYQIREALTGWTQAGATRDSLAGMQIGSSILGRIEGPLAPYDTLVIQLTDTAAIRRYLNTLIDSTSTPMNGFVIIPAPGTNPGMVGFASAISSYLSPTLTVRISKNDAYDTLYFSSSEDTFLATAKATTKPELEVRGGVSTWSKLKFDFSKLSQSSIVNNATLELTQNSASTMLGVGTTDTLYAYLSRKGSSLQTIDSTYRILGKRKDTTSTTNPVYVFTITPYVQFLISQGTPYDGIVLQSGANIASVDHRVFYSSKDADVTKRPRILITTSKK